MCCNLLACNDFRRVQETCCRLMSNYSINRFPRNFLKHRFLTRTTHHFCDGRIRNLLVYLELVQKLNLLIFVFFTCCNQNYQFLTNNLILLRVPRILYLRKVLHPIKFRSKMFQTELNNYRPISLPQIA